jgi:transcriptional regulator with XRE-family HTH domain
MPPGGRATTLTPDWRSMRELRQSRGLSQGRLAELSGVSERTVRAIERGGVERPQLESLRRIARVLAYSEGHAQRLVERWTGATAVLTPQQIGVPGWESLYRRIRARAPEDGGQQSSSVSDATIHRDGTPLVTSHLHVHEAMSPTGPPVLWKLISGMPFDLTTARFEVTAGGVLEDFFVHGDIGALAIRPDPVLAGKGPFAVQFSIDYRDAVRNDRLPEAEWMYGANSVLRSAVLIVRFVGRPPEQVWHVQGTGAASAERLGSVPVSPDGSAQLCLHDFVGVYGLQWDAQDAGG